MEAERAAKPSARESTSEETREGDNGEARGTLAGPPARNAAASCSSRPCKTSTHRARHREPRGIPALLESGVYAWVSHERPSRCAPAPSSGVRTSPARFTPGSAHRLRGCGNRPPCAPSSGWTRTSSRAFRAPPACSRSSKGPRPGCLNRFSAAGLIQQARRRAGSGGSNARPTARGPQNLGWSVTARDALRHGARRTGGARRAEPQRRPRPLPAGEHS